MVLLPAGSIEAGLGGHPLVRKEVREFLRVHGIAYKRAFVGDTMNPQEFNMPY